MATVRTVTLPDGSTFTMSDWGDYPLFSRCEIDATNAQDVITFNYVQSQQIPGAATNGRATLMDTNMPTASQLPLRHQMVIFSVQMRFDEIDTVSNGNSLSQATEIIAGGDVLTASMGLNKWNIFTSNVYFVLLVENVKPYTEGPLTQYPHGGGLYFNNNTPALAVPGGENAYNIQNGEPGTHAARRLAMPVHLGALEQFQGLLKYPRGSILAALIAAGMKNGAGACTSGKFGVNIGLFGPRQRPIG